MHFIFYRFCLLINGFLLNDKQILLFLNNSILRKLKPTGTHNYFVYITTNPSKTVLYTGVTNDLIFRLHQHFMNRGKKETFAGRYYCYKLVYFEHFDDINMAIEREKFIKDLSNKKKLELIKEINSGLNFIVLQKE